jgi:hypothetical protein
VGTSRGRTVILNEGEIVPPNGQPAPAPSKEPTTHTGEQSFGVVYANAPARGPIGSPEAQTFPAGSIIVRERLANAESQLPELLAVMIKHAPGFNPKGGDWEFLLVDGAGSKVIERQKKGSCLDCHAKQRERDFIYPVPAIK